MSLSVSVATTMALPAVHVTLLNDGVRAALSREDGVIGLLCLATGEVEWVSAPEPPQFYDPDEADHRPGELFRSPDVTADGTTAVALYDLGALVYDLPSAQPRHVLVQRWNEDDEDEAEDVVRLPAFSRFIPTTGEVAVMYGAADAGVPVVLWDLESGDLTGELDGEPFVAVAPHPDGRRWFVADEASALVCWNVASRQLESVNHPGASGGSAARWASLLTDTPPSALIDALAVDTFGNKLLTLDREGLLEVFETGSGESLCHAEMDTAGHGGAYSPAYRLVSIHPGGRHFLVPDEAVLTAVNIEDQQAIWSCVAHGCLTEACYLPDGHHVLTVADQRLLQIWNLGQEPSLAGWNSKAPISAWALSESGTLVLSDLDGTVSILRLNDYRAPQALDSLHRPQWDA